MEIIELVKLITEAAEQEKAADITELRVHEITVLADYFIVASGRSTQHVKSIADAVVQAVEAVGIPLLRQDGYGEGKWIVLDFGMVIFHAFRITEREFYKLEDLWSDAPRQAEEPGDA